MTSTKRWGWLLSALLLVGLAATSLPGQVTSTKPITVKAPKPKKEKFKGEVLNATRVTIMVRDRKNANLVRTFTYNEKVSEKINKWFDENRIFQHGDKVEIIYLAGTDQAIKIKGKPSRNY